MTEGRSPAGGGGDREHRQQQPPPPPSVWRRDSGRIAILLVGAAVLCLVVYHSASRFQPLPLLFSFSALPPQLTAAESDFNNTHTFNSEDMQKLAGVLGEAATENKTVIITTLNRAWAEPNSTFDLFLESFLVGEGTGRLLRHVVVVCLDEKAYSRCLEVHGRCYYLRTAGTDFSGEKEFMTPDYLKMMWRRVDFLASVLQLGYSFLFTDADIVWLRDPFPRLFANADFQIACDHYTGDSYDVDNRVNGGFTYVRANNRAIKFYKFWYASRLRFPGKHDQDVFNKIKRDRLVAKIGLRMRFLDTVYFGGFCEPSRDISRVCTMHANCCIGLENKVRDLRQVLEDWRNYTAAAAEAAATEEKREVRRMTWRRLENCRRSMGH